MSYFYKFLDFVDEEDNGDYYEIRRENDRLLIAVTRGKENAKLVTSALNVSGPLLNIINKKAPHDHLDVIYEPEEK